MQLRLTVVSPAHGVNTDVLVECDPTEPVGRVLEVVGTQLSLAGQPTVDGGSVVREQPVAASPVRNGAILTYGGGTSFTPPPPPVGGLVLRVVAGPDAGQARRLTPGDRLRIGRDPVANQLVLTDPEVSGRHATVTVGAQITGAQISIADENSSNGTFVDGARVQQATVDGDSVIQLGGTRLRVERQGQLQLTVEPDGKGRWLVNRTPRNPRPWSPDPVELPAELEPEDEPRSKLTLVAMIAAPLVLAGVMVAITHQPRYLLIGVLSPLLAGLNWGLERSRQTKRRRRRESTHAEALAAVRVHLQRAADVESEHLHSEWPAPQRVLDAVALPGALLWSRKPADHDWAQLRLGVADRTITDPIAGGRRQTSLPVEIPVLKDAPIGVSLGQHRVVGVAGAPAQGIVSWLMLQCAALHSPDDLGIFVFGERPDDFAWLRWPPHAVVAWTREQRDELVTALSARIDEAERQSKDSRGAGTVVHTVVLLLKWFRLEQKDALSRLIERGAPLGVAFIDVEDDPLNLHRDCTAQLVIGGGGLATLSAQGVYHEEKLKLDTVSPTAVENAARALAPRWPSGANTEANMPTLVSFYELLRGRPTPDQVRAGWRVRPFHTQVPIGRNATDVITVDIVGQGPHGLVAGTSGSGKSELLQAILGGLALFNTPQRLNLFLVDYKGGATYIDLRKLPHVVAVVTNLGPELAKRALDSLDAELARRQHWITQVANAGNLEDYLLARSTNPQWPQIAQLVVVVDEYAELKKALPEAAERFESVARVGRTLGVNVILAMQSPTGVVNQQIRTNMNLHMTMRVQDRGESIDMINAPDAAQIPSSVKGRGFVQSGSDRAREVQVAWMTMPLGTGAGPALRVVPLRWFDLGAPAADTGPHRGGPTVIGELTATITEAAAAEGLTAPHRPFSEPLPATVLLSTLPTRARHITLGLQDLPRVPAQLPLQVPLGDGHLAIIGGPGTGRTTALRTVALSAAQGGGVHLHVIDGKRQLHGLADLPNCGVVAAPEDERTDRLLERLVATMRRRQAALEQAHQGSVTEWWDDDPATAPPHILLLIDGSAGLGLAAGGGGANDDQRREQMRKLLQGGRQVGITVVLAADDIGFGLLTQFPHLAVLRSDAGGRFEGRVSARDVAGLGDGRAIWSEDKTQVQIAILAEEPTGRAQNVALAAQAARLRATIAEDESLIRLDLLPEEVGFAAALAHDPVPTTIAALAGLGRDRLTALWTPLPEGATVAITGSQRGDRTKAVAAVAASVARTGGRVLLVGLPGPVTQAAVDQGCRLIGPADLAAELAIGLPDVLAVDGALIELGVDLLPAMRSGLRVIAAATNEEFDRLADKALKEVARRAVAKIVLTPSSHHAGSGLGITLDRADTFTGPSLRAVVEIEGELTRAQLPDLTLGA